MTWLIEKLGGKLAAYGVAALLALVIAALLLGLGYWRGYTSADNKAQVQVLTLQNESLQASLTEATDKLKQMEAMRSENAQLVKQIEAAQGQTRVVYRTLRQQAKQVTQAIASPSGGGAAVCVVSAEFVRLWDDALTARVRDAAGGAGDAVASAGAAADDSEASDIDVGQLLDNHIDNGEINAGIRQQCSALIEWHHKHDAQANR